MICSVLLLSLLGLVVAVPPSPVVSNYYNTPTHTETRVAGELGLPSGSSQVVPNLRNTFSCINHPYGYYADIINNCQIYHVCQPSNDANGNPVIYHYSAFCPANTRFDQRKLTCIPFNHEEILPCEQSEHFFPTTANQFLVGGQSNVFVSTRTNTPVVTGQVYQRTHVVQDQLPVATHTSEHTTFHTGKTNVRNDFPTKGGNFPTKGGNNFPTKNLPNFPTKNLPTFPTKNLPTKTVPVTNVREVIRPSAYPVENFEFTTTTFPTKTNFVPQRVITQERVETPVEHAPVKGNTNFPTKNLPTRAFPTKNIEPLVVKSPLVVHTQQVIRPAARQFNENFNTNLPFFTTTIAHSNINFVTQRPITQERVEQAPVEQTPIVQEVLPVRQTPIVQEHIQQTPVTQERIVPEPIIQQREVPITQVREVPVTQVRETPITQVRETPIIQQRETPITQHRTPVLTEQHDFA